jgi:CelD/BcsL family acetyltransferase involved in cellulose biosynthesis
MSHDLADQVAGPGRTPCDRDTYGVVATETQAELESLQDLEDVREEWQAFEARVEESPYVSFEWLRAWERAYRPRGLAFVRIRQGRKVVAVGLLERGPRRMLRFAGRPASSECRLVCRSGVEGLAWCALAELFRKKRLGAFEARGLSRAAASGLPEGWAVPLAWLGLPLPGSFEEYLSKRSPGTRKGLKGKLRRAEREGVESRLVPESARSDALRDFVRLHQLRAASRGEHHPAVDDCLVQMFEELVGDRRPRLFELIADHQRIGVTVRVDTRRAAYFYNAGIDPKWEHVSPGILLQLASIRDAIDLGLQKYDLGPGDFRYKRDLGGVLLERYQIAIRRQTLRMRLGLSRAELVGHLRHWSPDANAKNMADQSSIDSTTS